MKNQNLDGIKKFKTRRRVKRKGTITVDSIVKRQISRLSAVSVKKPSFIVPFKAVGKSDAPFIFWQRFQIKKTVPVAVAILGIIIAFGAGSWAALNTSKSVADEEPKVLGAYTDRPANRPQEAGVILSVSNAPVTTTAGNKISNEVLLSLTLNQLENYLNEALKTPEVKQAEILAARKEKLKVYLAEKKSPFVDIADTLAGLKHWKLVLAISNSESTLGKRCYTNNCSGIGIEPGHPLWREYSSTAEWAKDLDRLIEKRYKDWTLEQMNGVYNKPGSANWIFAATQILDDIKDRGIE